MSADTGPCEWRRSPRGDVMGRQFEWHPACSTRAIVHASRADVARFKLCPGCRRPIVLPHRKAPPIGEDLGFDLCRLLIWCALLIALVSLGRCALAGLPGGFQWGAQWAWQRDQLSISWDYAEGYDGPRLGNVNVLARVTTFDGDETALKVSAPASDSAPIVLPGGTANWFYCGISVTVVFQLDGYEEQTRTLERPYVYPPTLPERCD